MAHRLHLLCLLVMASLGSGAISGNDCQQSTPLGPLYKRTFLLMYDGPPPLIPANQSLALFTLGTCMDPNSAVSKMLEKLEGYGVDLSLLQDNPFTATHETDQATISFIGRDPKYPFRVLVNTLYTFSEYDEKHLYSIYWRIEAKVDLRGTKGGIQKGRDIYFGIFRLKLHGRDFCIEHYNLHHGTRNLGYLSFDKQLWSPEFGAGEGLGMTVAREDGSFHGRIVLTFPPS